MNINSPWSLVILLAMSATGCRQPASSGLPTIEMTIGSKSYTLEVASKPDDQETGLMRRDSMPSNHGMIFVFQQERPLTFWMKNTRIPLDILFLDATGRVVSIHQMKPYDESPTPSGGPCLYAIELNQGQADASGVKAGDRLAIPSLPK